MCVQQVRDDLFFRSVARSLSLLIDMVHSLLRHYRLWQNSRRLGSRRWAEIFAEQRAGILPAAALPEGTLHLRELDCVIGSEHRFVLRAYWYLLALKSCGFTFRAEADGEIEACGPGIRVRLNSNEECFILREIFCEHIYDVQPAEGALVIDIGMNIGLASLFFAASLPKSRVIAFEPFPSTFARAQRQFGLNAELASRIESHPFGLWRADDRRTLACRPDAKGSTGLWGIHAGPALADGEAVKQGIVLRDAAAVLGPLLEQHAGRTPVILKIDCEGAEYEIFDRLSEAGLAGRFDVILMEWHRLQPDHSPQRLRSRLMAEGYRTHCRGADNATFDMLYAFRIQSGIQRTAP